LPKAERERKRGEKAHGREMRCDAITIEALIAIYLFSPLIVSISFARARKTLFWLDFSFFPSTSSRYSITYCARVIWLFSMLPVTDSFFYVT
jgi:hypothetical protein